MRETESRFEEKASTVLSRNVELLVVAMLLGIGTWLVTGVNEVQKTLVQIDTTLKQQVTAMALMEVRLQKVQADYYAMDKRLATVEKQEEKG